MKDSTEHKLHPVGVYSALAAFTFWGLVPIYYKGLSAVGAWEVLAHRVIWSIPVLLLFMAIRDRKDFWKRLLLPPRTVAWLVLSGLTVSLNWLVFVWAVANDHILDTSLGYFATPLVNVLLGYFFLKERLPALQLVGVVLAAVGTVYLGWYMGKPPWIAITLAVSFGFYGLLRKRLTVTPTLGLLWETTLMVIPAIVYLLWLADQNNQEFLKISLSVDLLLLGSGLATVVPLIWFNMAAQKLPLSVLGFFQYLAPCMSFTIAVFFYGETFTFGHAVAFSCIWMALALVSVQPFRRARRRLRG